MLEPYIRPWRRVYGDLQLALTLRRLLARSPFFYVVCASMAHVAHIKPSLLLAKVYIYIYNTTGNAVSQSMRSILP